MKRFCLLTTGILTIFLLSGCATNTGAPTGFQKGMQTVGHTTWAATKAVGFGFGFLTEKIGQGIALAGHGVAASGGALETASVH